MRSFRTAACAAALAGVALAGAALPGCVFHVGGNGVKGSGKIAEETRSVGAFDRIDIEGEAKLEATVGNGAPSLVIAADDNLLPLIGTELRGHTLRIYPKEPYNDTHGHGIRVRLTVPALRGVTVGGACSGTIDGVSGDEFDIEIAGAGQLTASGAAKLVRVRVSGSGEIDIQKVTAESAEVDVSGAGHVRLTATASLDAKVSGVGDVRYAGNPPNVRRKVHGIGKIEPL